MKYFGLLLVVVAIVGGVYLLRAQEVVAPEAEEGTAATESSAAFLGEWQSTEDAQFVRSFSEEVYEDRYGDAVVGTGQWRTFRGEDAPTDFSYPREDGVVYLTLGDGQETLSFSVAEHTRDTLVLIYLDRGGVLEFSRMRQ